MLLGSISVLKDEEIEKLKFELLDKERKLSSLKEKHASCQELTKQTQNEVKYYRKLIIDKDENIREMSQVIIDLKYTILDYEQLKDEHAQKLKEIERFDVELAKRKPIYDAEFEIAKLNKTLEARNNQIEELNGIIDNFGSEVKKREEALSQIRDGFEKELNNEREKFNAISKLFKSDTLKKQDLIREFSIKLEKKEIVINSLVEDMKHLKDVLKTKELQIQVRIMVEIGTQPSSILNSSYFYSFIGVGTFLY